MFPRLASLLWLLLPVALLAQPGTPQPRPATQGEVDAGLLTRPYVSPATLRGWQGGTNLTFSNSFYLETNWTRAGTLLRPTIGGDIVSGRTNRFGVSQVTNAVWIGATSGVADTVLRLGPSTNASTKRTVMRIDPPNADTNSGPFELISQVYSNNGANPRPNIVLSLGYNPGATVTDSRFYLNQESHYDGGGAVSNAAFETYWQFNGTNGFNFRPWSMVTRKYVGEAYPFVRHDLQVSQGYIFDTYGQNQGLAYLPFGTNSGDGFEWTFNGVPYFIAGNNNSDLYVRPVTNGTTRVVVASDWTDGGNNQNLLQLLAANAGHYLQSRATGTNVPTPIYLSVENNIGVIIATNGHLTFPNGFDFPMLTNITVYGQINFPDMPIVLGTNGDKIEWQPATRTMLFHNGTQATTNWWFNDTDLIENIKFGSGDNVVIRGSTNLTLNLNDGINQLQGAYRLTASPGPTKMDFGTATELRLDGNARLVFSSASTNLPPTTNGLPGQTLTTDGANPAQLYWSTGSGSVVASDVFTNSNSTISNIVAGSNMVLRTFGNPSGLGYTNFEFRTTAGRVGNKTNALASFWNGPTNALNLGLEGGLEMWPADSRVWQMTGLQKDQALIAFRDLERDTNANPNLNIGVYNPVVGEGGNGTDFILSLSHQSILSQFDTFGGHTTNKAFFGIQAHRTAGQGGASDLRLWGFVRDNDRWQIQPTVTKASGDTPYYWDTAEYRDGTYSQLSHTDFKNFGTNVFSVRNNGALAQRAPNGNTLVHSIANNFASFGYSGLTSAFNTHSNGSFSLEALTVNTNVALQLFEPFTGVPYLKFLTNLPGTGNFLAAGADGSVFRTNATGTGSQTPWTSDIDAAHFSLTNLDTLGWYSGGASIADAQASADELKIKTAGLSMDAFVNGYLSLQQRNAATNARMFEVLDNVGAVRFRVETNKFTFNGGNVVISNSVVSPLTILAANNTKTVTSVANGTGMLTNDGAGTFGWMTIPSGGAGSGIDAGFTNNGTITYPFASGSEGTIRITNGTSSGFSMLDAGTGPLLHVFGDTGSGSIVAKASADLRLGADAGVKWRIDGATGDWVPNSSGLNVGQAGAPIQTLYAESVETLGTDHDGYYDMLGTNTTSRTRLTINPDEGITNEFRIDVGPGAFAGDAAFVIHSVTALGPTNIIVLTNQVAQQVAAASVLTFDRRFTQMLMQTNRATAAETLVLTNFAAGQIGTAIIPGEASGGTDRNITVAVAAGDLIRLNGAAPVASLTLNATNGIEWEINVLKKSFRSTNYWDLRTSFNVQ